MNVYKQKVKCKFDLYLEYNDSDSNNHYENTFGENNQEADEDIVDETGYTYECIIDHKIIKENASLEFIAKHRDGKSDSDVSKISFFDCDINVILQGLIKTFPNLKVIGIYSSNLKIIESKDLKEYIQLTGLFLARNELQFLPGDLLKDMKNLEKVSFGGNKIQMIEPNLLDGLSKLKYANFCQNPVIDKTFNNLGNLIGYIGNASLNEIKNEIREIYSKTLSKWILEKIKNEISQAAKMESGISADFLDVIQNDDFKDFAITVGDEEFKVHKILLIARSPVLAEMIQNNKDAECLTLTDVSAEIFKEILNFLYVDELSANDVDYMKLYSAAGRLEMEKLTNLAADKLLQEVNSENAFDILALANKYENDELRQKSFNEIKKILGIAELNEKFATDTAKVKIALEMDKKKKDFVKAMETEINNLFIAD